MSYLVDTDVLIDYLREYQPAVEFLEAHVETSHTSAITAAELYQGVREGKERAQLKNMLAALRVIPITEIIAEKGGLFARDYKPTHGCGLADCLIAASAEAMGLVLVTQNKRHFPMLDNVEVPYCRA